METKKELLQIPKTNFIGDDGWIINGSELEYMDEGTNATIWKYSRLGQKYAFKVFKEGRHSYSLNYNVYEVMKNLPLRNIAKPLEGYIKEDTTRSRWIDAYLMEFIDKGNFEPITEFSMENIITNVHNFDYNAEVLSDSGITMFDVGVRNSIIDKEHKINLTDIDMYFINVNCQNDYILQYNRSILANLLRYYFKKSLEIDNDFNELEVKLLNQELEGYFRMDEFQSETVSSKVERLFGNYETPKQYFLQRKGKI